MDRKENNIGSDTIVFSIKNSKDSEMKRILTTVYDALVEKGYDLLALASIAGVKNKKITWADE